MLGWGPTYPYSSSYRSIGETNEFTTTLLIRHVVDFVKGLVNTLHKHDPLNSSGFQHSWTFSIIPLIVANSTVGIQAKKPSAHIN